MTNQFAVSPEPIRAYGYRRVSKVGIRGDELISPELQTHASEEWAARNNVVIVKWFEDLDETGREFEKRKVKEMVAGIQSGDAEMVVLWKWSRWGRNLQQSSLYIAAVEAVGGQVRAATEDFDPKTTIGKYTRDQMLMIAELISNQIGDGWKETHARRRRQGLPHTAAARYGYDYSRDEGYTIREDESVIVKEMYKRAVAGETLTAISQNLNERGIFTRKGNPWAPTGLARMLDTGFPAGLIRERSHPDPKKAKGSIKHFDVWREGAHAAIIDSDLWTLYKDMRTASSNKPRRLLGATHALSGLLMCKECGGMMTVVYSGTHNKHAWTCGRRRHLKEMGAEVHAPVSISNNRALALVRGWVEGNRTGEPKDMRTRVQRAANKPAPVTNLDNLTARVTELEEQRSELSRMKMKRQISEKDYDKLWKEVGASLEQAEIDLASARANVPRTENNPAAWEALSTVWEIAEPEELHRLLSAVLSAGIVRPGPYSDDKAVFVPAWE